jgi:hypothetical protein
VVLADPDGRRRLTGLPIARLSVFSETKSQLLHSFSNISRVNGQIYAIPICLISLYFFEKRSSKISLRVAHSRKVETFRAGSCMSIHLNLCMKVVSKIHRVFFTWAPDWGRTQLVSCAGMSRFYYYSAKYRSPCILSSHTCGTSPGASSAQDEHY